MANPNQNDPQLALLATLLQQILTELQNQSVLLQNLSQALTPFGGK